MLPEYFPWKTCSYIRVPYFLLYVCVTRKKFLIPLPSHTVQMFRFLLNTLKFSHKLHVYIKTLWYNKLQFCYVFTASCLLPQYCCVLPSGPHPLQQYLEYVMCGFLQTEENVGSRYRGTICLNLNHTILYTVCENAASPSPFHRFHYILTS